jgi:hypothetical protein
MNPCLKGLHLGKSIEEQISSNQEVQWPSRTKRSPMLSSGVRKFEDKIDNDGN